MYLNRNSFINKEATLEEATVTLMAVGDIMLGENALCLGHGVGSKIEKKGANYPFLQVASMLQEGDIIFGNLEAVLSNKGKKENQITTLQLRAAPEAAKGLKYAGFNILSLANNHTLEHGEEALLDTMNTLSEHNIKYVGVNSNVSRARNPLLIDIKGITIGFLAYCLIAEQTSYISINDPEQICSDVQTAKANFDVLVVSLHWGNEYIERPSPSQIRLARQIIDSGANLILGHHPHVLQGIEEYHNGVIAYSLGNFVFDMWQDEMRKSMILQVTLSKQGITNVQVIPVYINDDCQPEVLGDKEGKNLLSDIEKYSLRLTADDTADFEKSMREYEVEAAANRKWHRRGLKWYFLRHFYRYTPRFALQLAKGYLSRKLRQPS